MQRELMSALRESASDPECRAVIIRGAGAAFCAGADVEDLVRARTDSDGARYGRLFEDVCEAIASHPAPVVAQVHGGALGGGCQLVVACDLAVAATDARLGIPSGRLGILIGYESVQRLVMAIGPKRAGELLYSGRIVSGDEAAAWGMVNEAVAPEALADRTEALAAAIAECAPLSVRGSKLGIVTVGARLWSDPSLREEFDSMLAVALASEDLAEGLLAFRDRRKPQFRGT
jgi:enoyl-CoA hydratase